MSRDVQCTITNPNRAELFQDVFGTTTVYVENAVGEMAILPELGERHVYRLDLTEMTPEQKAKLASRLSVRFGISFADIVPMIEHWGVPILAEDCVLTLTGAAARSLMPDDMDWGES